MKKLIGLLTFILIGLINFGYCDKVLPTDEWDGNHVYEGIFDYYGEYMTFNSPTKVTFSYPNLSFVCFKKRYSPTQGDNGNGMYSLDGVNWVNAFSHEIGCVSADDEIWFKGGEIIFSYFIYGDGYIQPLWTSLTCQQEYNLIPISSVDQNYCVNNGLCPSGGGDCPVCPGSGDNWSALYVNDIQHLGKPIINITIPDYITWDYTTNENEFNLYCGSGYDQDYIDSIISINSYRPDSGDFTNIFVSGLTLVFPYIVIVLFIVFVRRLLKRIFR